MNGPDAPATAPLDGVPTPAAEPAAAAPPPGPPPGGGDREPSGLLAYFLIFSLLLGVVTGVVADWPPQLGWGWSRPNGLRAILGAVAATLLAASLIEHRVARHGLLSRAYLFGAAIALFALVAREPMVANPETVQVESKVLVIIGLGVLASSALMMIIFRDFSTVLALTLVAVLYFAAKLGLTIGLWELTRHRTAPGEPGRLVQAFESRPELKAARFRVVDGEGRARPELEGTDLARRLDDKLAKLLDRQSALRFAFVDNTPTSDILAFRAFQAVYRDVVDGNQGGTTVSVHDVETGVEEHNELMKELKDKKALFLDVAKYVRDEYRGLQGALLVIDIACGKSYGIHLLCYLFFAYCLGAFLWRVPPPRDAPAGSVEDEVEQRRNDGTVERILFCRDALPQLGFIGTLIGLSLAIFQLGEADPTQEILGRSGISPALAANLGLAFNTTLIALLLVLALGVAFSRLASRRPGDDDYYRRLAELIRASG